MKGVRVTCLDLETGEEETQVCPPGDYIIVTVDPCHVDGLQAYPAKGTHVLIVKGCKRAAEGTGG